ncbi:MAG TPA: EAL domain-containing protein, partial [Steroidobacteraceae bacterium]|nr:EAL domain-containing protein [Steroidobacteraceae bacterium]
MSRFADPAVLFPTIAVLLLGVIWTATAELVKVRYADARLAAAASNRELLGTYEAQVVRALREIDQSLNLVKYWRERDRGRQTLAELKDKGLLPPDLLFTVSIADAHGAIIDSTAPLPRPDVADKDYFLAQRESEMLSVGRPPRGAADDTTLPFSRRLNKADGSFDGVVIVMVGAGYFVSGYDASKLGEHGVLAIVGTDGIVRVRRSGESAFAGDKIDYDHAITQLAAIDTDATISVNSWDGIKRWTGAHELYGFPLAVVVGLSVDEQLAGAHHEALSYWWRAGAGSLLVIVLTALLGRLSWQLAQSRLREGEIKLEHAKRVEYLAYHDGLTGLPNRSMFSKMLSQSLSEAHRYGRRLGVAFLDLDRFKQINDTLGHEAGDQLLQDVAKRLKGCVRESDTVARLGGDEFVVLLPELNDVKHAGVIAEKILAAIAKPFTLIGHEFRVTASIGISAYPMDGLDEQTLTKNADVAMYKAKSEGKNNFQFYSESLNANSLERLTLESSLRHALERHEFRLRYQAKRDMHSGRITGMEALLRWEHPDLGLVAPMQFIPVAEESSLMLPIGKWVLRTACAQNVAWQKAGVPRLKMAVNLTGTQFFDEHLIDDVTAILESTGMDACLLEFEISERLLIRDVEATVQVLTRLKQMGIGIAIDDFGTGYSSLTTLQRFPLNTIKIDRSLVAGMCAGAENMEFAESVIAMGKNLSLTVVAQGVETRAQADFLRDHACDELQG